MSFEMLEYWIGQVGAVAALITLTAELIGFRRADAHPAGRVSGPGHRFLRSPILIVATVAFVALGALLWRPLPLSLSVDARVIALLIGSLIYFPSLLLYLWGFRALGPMFGAASGFGVRLQAGHRLVTHGPYRYVRHPMYLAVILAGFGGLLIYRTWAMLAFVVSMSGLGIRARREEQVLAEEFGEEWKVYAQQVPAWIPRLRRR